MKISTLRNLLTAVVCLFGALSAQAQFTATYEPYPASAWGNEKPINFSLSEVATTLSTDTATLVAALDAWEMGTDDMFFLTTPEGESADYTQGGKGGFWVNADGMPQAWSDDNSALRWFNMIGWSADDDQFTITIGQFPAQCAAGDTFKPHFTLKYGDKTATFDITINIIETPSYDLPDPTLLWKQLNIVDEQVIDVNQKPRSGYDADAVQVNLTEALAKLGITDMQLVNIKLSDMLYATEYYITDDIALGSFKSDTLTNNTSAGGIGFWMQDYENQEAGDAIECCRSNYSNSCKFYVESFEFDAETGILSCNLGQYPGSVEGGKTYFTNIYLIYGDKAICVRYNLNIELVELGTLENYTKAGESTIDVTMAPMSTYSTKTFKTGIEEIAATLGCQVADIDDFYALASDVDFATHNTSANGYWFDIEGNVTAWSSAEDGQNVFYMDPTGDDFSKLQIGQHPGRLKEGDVATANIYFLGNGKYYKVTVRLNVQEQQYTGEFQNVATRSYQVQQEVSGYVWTPGIDIPNEFIEENIGDDWTVYGMSLLDDEGNEREGNAKYTNSYSITESPGFWLDKDGRNSGWGDNAIFGITAGGYSAASGKFCLMQYPDRCNVGDVYKTKLYFVNETTNKMVTFNFTYLIVEEVVEYENVGYEDIVIPVAEDDQITDIDLTKAAEALGTTVDNLLDTENACLHGMTEGGIFGSGQSCADGLGFNADGFFDMAYPLVCFTIDESKIWSYSVEPVADDFSLSTQFCLQVDDKQYVYNVKFVSTAIYTGIQNVATEKKTTNKVFDLSGRQVLQPTRGLYIMNGKKVIVK